MTAVVFFSGYKVMRNINIAIALVSFFFLLFYLQNHATWMTLSNEVVSTMKISGYINLLTLFIFTIMFFSSFVKQNGVFQEELSKQNTILEHKNNQIIDSIEYAKHIQEAMLPPIDAVKDHFKESFIFYKPKDIVAGDFYWINPLPGGSVLFAAADSTGHGVPGAMVSVICTNALNRSVNEFGLTDPGLILDKTRELITDCFQRSGQDVKDGMDISLCLFNPETKALKWAGANNPLWIINSQAEEITVVKPDKQTVGNTPNAQPFKTHEVQLEKGDCFYLFTDGYADQFGGSEAKKFMQKRMKELLLNICKMPMEFQKYMIHENLLTWMGNQEQVDDICFAGIKI
jgi:serine phosphatase RsbU (regulator of sigma subunit)